MSKVIALVPAYNEAGTIGDIVRGIRAMGHAVYVVDDGSSDNTAAAAGREGAVVIANGRNMGKGASLRVGFGEILKSDFDAAIVIDGDGQHEVDSIPDFIRMMESSDSDIVIGNRMLDTGDMPMVRKQTNLFMSNLISKISGQKVPDTQCGYRLIKRRVLERVKLDTSNFEIESELIIKAGRAGFKISSVPIRAVYRGEKSKINPIIDTIRFAALVIKTGFNKEMIR